MLLKGGKHMQTLKHSLHITCSIKQKNNKQ